MSKQVLLTICCRTLQNLYDQYGLFGRVFLKVFQNVYAS